MQIRIAWKGQKFDQKVFQTFWAPTPVNCAEKFPLMSMGGRAEGLAWADPKWGPPSPEAKIIYNLVP